MEDHYDKVLQRVTTAHATYSKALEELLNGIDKVATVVDRNDAAATTNPDAVKKTLKKLKSLLDEIVDRSEKHEEEKLLQKSKAARSSLAVLRQRLRSSNGKAPQPQPTVTSSGSSQKATSIDSSTTKTSMTSRKEVKKKKAIAMSVLSMQSLGELVTLAKRCSDKPENLINILKRLKKTQVSAEKLKQTGAGVYVAGLKKHENPQVAALAKSVVTIWKESVKAASKKESKKQSSKSSSNGNDKGKKEVSKFAKLDPKAVRRQQEQAQAKSKRRPNAQERIRSTKKKRRDVEVEVEARPLSQEEWERQYLNRARQGYDKYQEEENYSAYVGKQDDLKSMREDGY